MKSAEEWVDEMGFNVQARVPIAIGTPTYLSIVQDIQSDARAQGMRDAAEIAQKSKTTAMGDMPDERRVGATKAIQAILTAAEKLEKV